MRDEFLKKLRAFYAAHGSPKYPTIIKMSEKLDEIYETRFGRKSLPTYTKTTLSDTLNGHRAGLPDSEFVASFVLCCQRIAFETGAILVDPGVTSLPYWHQELQKAVAKAKQCGLPQLRGRVSKNDQSDADAPDPMIAPEVMFGPGAAVQAPGQSSTALGPVPLTDGQVMYMRTYGNYAKQLSVRVLAGDPHAAYQLGVLLAASPHHEDGATTQLTSAAVTGQPHALELLQASPQHLDKHIAAAHARALTEQARNANFPDAAVAFFEAAAALNANSVAMPSHSISEDTTAS